MYNLVFQIKRANLTRRKHNALMNRLNRRAMERQRDERLWQHFELGAYAKYKARQRSKKYNEGKLRAKNVGHIRPNVRTGYLQKSIRTKITSTPDGARLFIRAQMRPRLSDKKWKKLTPREKVIENRKRRRLAQWQKEEIATLSKQEIRDERKRQAREYKHGATSPEFRRQRNVRIR